MKANWSKENITNIVAEEVSAAGVLRRLNLKYTGANYKSLYAHISEYSLDTSHWTGRNKHRKQKEHLSKVDINILLVENSPIQSNRLKQRLITEGHIKYQCSICKIKDYNNKPITLQLHHINGIATDNRIENIQLLCPNCHSQPGNFGGKTSTSIHNIETCEHRCKICKKIIWDKRYYYCGDCWNSNRKELMNNGHVA